MNPATVRTWFILTVWALALAGALAAIAAALPKGGAA